jgi:hypothetical protein
LVHFCGLFFGAGIAGGSASLAAHSTLTLAALLFLRVCVLQSLVKKTPSLLTSHGRGVPTRFVLEMQQLALLVPQLSSSLTTCRRHAQRQSVRAPHRCKEPEPKPRLLIVRRMAPIVRCARELDGPHVGAYEDHSNVGRISDHTAAGSTGVQSSTRDA